MTTKVPSHSHDRPKRDGRPASQPAQGPVVGEQRIAMALQRSAGNAAVAALVGQRQAAASPPVTARRRLLTDADEADGAMGKTEFLEQLRQALTATADQALAGTIWQAVGCPWIERWIGYYNSKNAAHVEQAITRFAPETSAAITARDYIPLICQRVRVAVARWSQTGEVTGVPEELRQAWPGTNEGAANEGAAVTASMKSATGGGGTATVPSFPGPLGAGRTLDMPLRTSMESAFAQDFSGVRVHTDASAARFSAGLDARAFTVGQDVVFGSGQYEPGTPKGDALIAHELAHVVQQSGTTAPAAMGKGAVSDDVLESEADMAALKAVAPLWGGSERSLALASLAIPKARSGLRLQRCKDGGGASGPEPTVAAHPSLADQADALGGESVTMESYLKYQDKIWKWFFSPNSALSGAASKPAKLDSWADWTGMHWQSRQVVGDLAGVDVSRMAKDAATLKKLKDGYAKWPAGKLAIFQSAAAGTDTNSCNVFLGDALYLAGKSQVTKGKYYSANQVYSEAGSFTAIDKKDLARGDIIANGGHVEIITSVDTAAGTFCSRGGYRPPIGGELCADARRRIEGSGWKYLRVK